MGGRVQLVARAASTVVAVSALPGGEAVLVELWSDTADFSRTLAALSLADGRIVPLGVRGNYPQYSRTGDILFAQRGDIFAAPFSLRTLRLGGPPVPVARDAAVSRFAVAAFTVRDATLAYMAGDPASARLYAVDANGSERALSGDLRFIGWPRVSPDGERVALEVSNEHKAFDIWVYELRSETLARVTNTGFSLRPTGWSADGKGIYYIATDSANYAAPRSVSWVSWDRSAARRELLRIKEMVGGPD
jgi:hypothetical protein